MFSFLEAATTTLILAIIFRICQPRPARPTDQQRGTPTTARQNASPSPTSPSRHSPSSVTESMKTGLAGWSLRAQPSHRIGGQLLWVTGYVEDASGLIDAQIFEGF